MKELTREQELEIKYHFQKELHYLENGIPSGYMGLIEAALSDALRELHPSSGKVKANGEPVKPF